MLTIMRAKTISKVFFDGPAAGIMAKHLEHNCDAEAEAIEELDPGPDDHVLTIGFGPGIGVELLAPRVAKVTGIDLSTLLDASLRTSPQMRYSTAGLRENFTFVVAGRGGP